MSNDVFFRNPEVQNDELYLKFLNKWWYIFRNKHAQILL